jgi:hypothetical protein
VLLWTTLITFEGWMTAQVFLKLSSKLAAEQGVVDGLDGTVDFEHDTSSNVINSEVAVSHHSHKHTLSSSATRALPAEETMQNDSREKSKKKSSGSSVSSTM